MKRHAVESAVGGVSGRHVAPASEGSKRLFARLLQGSLKDAQREASRDEERRKAVERERRQEEERREAEDAKASEEFMASTEETWKRNEELLARYHRTSAQPPILWIERE